MGRKVKAFQTLVQSEIEDVPLEQIEGTVFNLRHGVPNPSLVQSIREFGGVIEPIVIRLNPNDKLDKLSYQIIAGWNRYHACLEINRVRQHKVIKTIPARIIEATDKEALTISLTENLARKNLHWIEEGIGYLIFKGLQKVSGDVWLNPLLNTTGKNKSTIWRIITATTYILQVWDQSVETEALQRLAPWIFKIPMMAAQKLSDSELSHEEAKQIFEQIVTSEITVAELDAAIRKVKAGTSETIEEAVTTVKEEEEFKDVISTAIDQHDIPEDAPAPHIPEEVSEAEDGAELEEIKDTIEQIEKDPKDKQALLLKSLHLILGMLENRTLFCPDHPDQNESLSFDCGLELQEAIKKAQGE